MKTTRRRKLTVDAPVDDSCTINGVFDPSIPFSAEETSIAPPKQRSWDAKAVDDWISASLDVFKGIFIIFMLSEHTRSALSMGMSSKEPIMQFVSQVACSLDMTSFSAAYGFSCYRAYLTNSKNRPLREQLTRMGRSVGLIIAGAWLSNFHFEMSVLRNPITLHLVWRVISFELLYWDFLMSFPALLLMGFLTTKPLMKKFSDSRDGSTAGSLKRLALAALLLGWPMLASYFPLDTCSTVPRRYAAIFVGCISRSFGAMRFSAITYMFFFNFGCIVSQVLLEWVRDSKKASSTSIPIPSLWSIMHSPLGMGYALLLTGEIFYGVQMLGMYNRSWEYINYQGFRRFPMSTKVILAWGFFSQLVWALAVAGVAFLRADIWGLGLRILPTWLIRIGQFKLSMLEQFGANVLLYLVISNITIQGLFHVDWVEHFGHSATAGFTTRQWEIMVVAVASGQILLVQLIRYLVTSSRK